mgnify:CR=1 FL=1
MKYLKYFENNSISKDEIRNHLDDILSIFQEYIDEYNIENLELLKTYQNNSRNGIYYKLDFYATDYKIKKIYFRFITYIVDNSDICNVRFSGIFKVSISNQVHWLSEV